MKTAMQIMERPMLVEARRYCEERGLPFEELEQVRQMFVVSAFRDRMEPWHAMLVKLHPANYSVDLNAPLPEEYLKLVAQVHEMAQMTAADLGLTLEAAAAMSPHPVQETKGAV